jgi:hypothetical protein
MSSTATAKGGRKAAKSAMQQRAFRWIPDHTAAIDFGVEREGGKVSFVITDDGEVWIEGDPLGRPVDFVMCFDGPSVVNTVAEVIDLAAESFDLLRAGLRPAGSLSHRAAFDAARAQADESAAAFEEWKRARAQRAG